MYPLCINLDFRFTRTYYDGIVWKSRIIPKVLIIIVNDRFYNLYNIYFVNGNEYKSFLITKILVISKQNSEPLHHLTSALTSNMHPLCMMCVLDQYLFQAEESSDITGRKLTLNEII